MPLAEHKGMIRKTAGALVIVIGGLTFTGSRAFAADDRVTLVRTPDGGIQPQAMVGADGTIHLIYFKGQPSGGDLYYVSRKPGRDEFSSAIRVNSVAGSSIAVGTIRGGQLALGKGDRVHVAWNGPLALAFPNRRHEGAAMFYTRSTDDRTAFEPERDLMQKTSALDGGGSVAADGAGNVYVAWHGRAPDAPPGEQGRRLWIARSRDDGASFGAEEPALTTETGACGCCGARAFADRRGAVFVLYRAATAGVDRDMLLLTSPGPASPFRVTSLGAWKTNTCPMSSASFTDVGSDVLGAWETRGQVEFTRINPRDGSASPALRPPGGGGERKHPAVAANSRGETILVWAEGTGWQRGGALAWQVFDRDGHPTSEKGKVRNGIPVWGLAAVVARPDGGFTIIH